MRRVTVLFAVLFAVTTGCGDDGDTDATHRGVGEACTVTADCRNDTSQAEADVVDPLVLLECLTEFKGGYCGLEGCTAHADCPDGSRCVVADTGGTYCFLVCLDKVDCNVYRPVEVEANCVGNTNQVDGAKDVKICVPPSGA